MSKGLGRGLDSLIGKTKAKPFAEVAPLHPPEPTDAQAEPKPANSDASQTKPAAASNTPPSAAGIPAPKTNFADSTAASSTAANAARSARSAPAASAAEANAASAAAAPATRSAPEANSVPEARSTEASSAPAARSAPEARSATTNAANANSTNANTTTPAITTKPSSSGAPEAQNAPSGTLEIHISAIAPNPHQPRDQFKAESLNELAESIEKEGLLQPVLVRQLPNQRYELIAGERRLRACEQLGQSTILARLMEADEAKSAILALIENLQREDLDPIEEAQGFRRLMDKFGLTQEAIAKRLGSARASIANSLRLLKLSSELQGYVTQGLLSVGHAKVLLGIEIPAQREKFAERIVQGSWSVRQTETKAAQLRAPGALKTKAPKATSAELTAAAELERRISNQLGAKVTVDHGTKKGRLIIEYHGNDDLQRILERLQLD